MMARGSPRRYLDRERPRSPFAHTTDRVWLSTKGPMTQSGIAQCLPSAARLRHRPMCSFPRASPPVRGDLAGGRHDRGQCHGPYWPPDPVNARPLRRIHPGSASPGRLPEGSGERGDPEAVADPPLGVRARASSPSSRSGPLFGRRSSSSSGGVCHLGPRPPGCVDGRQLPQAEDRGQPRSTAVRLLFPSRADPMPSPVDIPGDQTSTVSKAMVWTRFWPCFRHATGPPMTIAPNDFTHLRVHSSLLDVRLMVPVTTIAPNDFTHLRVHSEFSLLDGSPNAISQR